MKERKVVMRIGMLWYEQGAKDVDVMIAKAAARYFSKFGVVPQYCHVHPDMFEKKGIIEEAGAMKIVADKTILPNHVWVGVIS